MSLQKIKLIKDLAEGIRSGSVVNIPSRHAAKLINNGKAEPAGENDEVKAVLKAVKTKSKAKIAEEVRKKKEIKNKSDDDKESKQNRVAKQKQKDDARKEGAELRKERGAVIDKDSVTEEEKK